VETLAFLDVNDEAIDRYGYSLEEFRSMTVRDIRPPEDIDRFERYFAADRSGISRSGIWRHRYKNGTVRFVDVLARDIEYAGRTARLVVAKDVTELLRAEEDQRLLFVLSRDLLAIIGFDGRLKRVNPAWTTNLGWREDQLVGARFEDFVHPEDRNRTAQVFEELHRGHPVTWLETRYRCRDESFRRIAWNSTPLLDRAEIYATGHDVTEARQARELVEAARHRIIAALEGMSDGFFALDRDWRFTYINAKGEEYLGRGREDLLGRTIWEEFPDLHGTRFPSEYRRAIDEQLSVTFEDFLAPQGRWYGVRAHPSPEGLAVYFVDITDQKRTDALLQQARKMEAVGNLAGGIAHDFNNLLTAILGYSELILDDLAPDNPHRVDLQEVRAAAKRAADLTQQLLAFSRKQVLQPVILSLNDVVQGLSRMIPRVISENVEITMKLAPDLRSVRADPTQLEQVLLNLVVNARDAMSEGGRLTIETSDVLLDPAAADEAGITAGRYVLLAVSDTGHGMTAEIRDRIFDPFFTTKEPGKGTGLGLATVYGIVNQSGGHIAVESDVDRGSTFRIYLPAVEAAPVEALTIGAPTHAIRGTEHILLVEDHPVVRTLARDMLQRLGYTVVTAASPQEALDLAAAEDLRIDLLVTDVIMPKMSGRQLVERLQVIRRELRALYVSGYAENVISHQGALDPDVNFLSKPFTPAALGIAVRKALDRK
jgi:PAS domain S-box-containing protein